MAKKEKKVTTSPENWYDFQDQVDREKHREVEEGKAARLLLWTILIECVLD